MCERVINPAESLIPDFRWTRLASETSWRAEAAFVLSVGWVGLVAWI